MPSEKRARQRAARQARLEAEQRAKKRRTQIRNVIIVLVVAGVIVGLTFLLTGNKKTVASQSNSTTTTSAAKSQDAKAQAAANAAAVKAGCPANPNTTVNHQTYSAAPPMTLDQSKLYSATVVTTAGTFDISLDAKAAPKSVNNFVFLAQKGYYHCVIFHRVIPQFMNQTGDPTGTGTGGPGYYLPAENPPAASNPNQQYPVGSLAMATTGAGQVSGSQFFIVTGPQGESLSPTYPLFGSVSSGMNVVQAINAEGNSNPSANGVPPKVIQRILSVTIHESSGL